MNRKRIFSFFIFLTILIVLLIAIRLLFIYLADENKNKNYVNPNISSEIIRGNITDRNGNLFAIQTPVYSLYFSLRNISDIEEAADLVAPFIGMNRNEIIAQAGKYTTYALIKRNINSFIVDELQTSIKETGFQNGIIIEKTQGRTYPATFHLSQIIGFTNIDNKGIEGIEYSYDDILSPYPEYEKDITCGDNIELTIDMDIQYLLDVQVQNIAYEHYPDYIMAMIMDAKSGEILASTSYPWYDLNNYQYSNFTERMNRNISYNFEPGSVFKIYSLAIFMEHGIDTNTPFYCDGSVTLENNGIKYTITCHEKHGEVTGREMIAKSCNGAVATWALEIDDETFYKALLSFGFNFKYDIGLTGVTRGSLSRPSVWSHRSKSTISFGQEISTNALQVVTAATALTNGGKLIKPSLIKSITSHDGKLIYKNEKEETEVISPEVASALLSYMQTAVESGTASKAKVNGTTVGAKTGTAQIINEETMSYEDGTNLASTLAVVPIDNPKYIIYFAASSPKGDSIWGANVAAPSVANIINGLISQGKISSENQQVFSISY